jgi:SAM-dependent methyltransferase
MLAAATRIAEAAGIDNIEARECTADRLPFPDATFDSATCRFGLMFVPDPGRAVAELARVVRPGGRIAVSVWARPDDNPWATIPAAAIADEVAQPAPGADTPGMFRCAAPGAVSALYQAAGLREITEWDVPVAMTTDTADEYWRMVSELTAPVVAALDQLDDAARGRVAVEVIRAAMRYQSSGALRLPGMSRCVVGAKQDGHPREPQLAQVPHR